MTLGKTSKLVFLWNNFGPMHADRVEAVAKDFPHKECIGIEMYSKAISYSWNSEERLNFRKVTLFKDVAKTSFLRRASKLIRLRFALRNAVWFTCHYERPEIFVLAIFLRLTGAKIFTMGCSKFDDMPRSSLREFLKSFFLRPYHGAIGSRERSHDYFRFLGFRKRPVVGPYNTLSLERMREQAGVESIHECSISFEERPWVIVSRLVPKKNLFAALEAFTAYRVHGGRRPLYVCGDGQLDIELKSKVAELELTGSVKFLGFLQSNDISKTLSTSLALLLPSIEEQFGNVVIEAQALGLPVLISTACGARDNLVRNWQNGFVFEPDNPEGLAQFMLLIDADVVLWTRLSNGATKTAPLGDVAAFSEAVSSLLLNEK